jgi:hypothetical protein
LSPFCCHGASPLNSLNKESPAWDLEIPSIVVHLIDIFDERRPIAIEGVPRHKPRDFCRQFASKASLNRPMMSF